MHDLTEAFSDCEDPESAPSDLKYYLVLKKWVDIQPSTEFRCFVSQNQLFGISQRKIRQFFPFMKDYTTVIKDTITSFYELYMKEKFSADTYTFDIVLRDLKRNPKVILVDLNPFGRVTDSLLFSWEELFLLHLASTTETLELDFRFISEQIHIQPTLSTSNAKPIESFDVSTSDGLLELIREQRRQERSEQKENNI